MLENFVCGVANAQDRLKEAAATGKTQRERSLEDFLRQCIDENEDHPESQAEAA